MSNEDPYRPNPGRDRGAYTPPTDDDLPFNRQGYDPRRGGGGKAPPMTLIISVAVLLAIIVAVLLLQPWETRSAGKAPPAVGSPVGDMKVEAPIDAQPVDPEAGIDVYSAAEGPTALPTFAPPPEVVQPRPAPQSVETAPASVVLPVPEKRPDPVFPPAEKAETPAPAVGGSAGVQIGAFSTTNLADQQFSAIMGRYPQFTRGATKRVQEVTASNGSTVYRTTVTGLSREQATGLCGAIKSAGGDCIVR
ncbi:SPOR domain-containing protein [Brevundimonas sp.]|uniref:SPOR domain-containing protein n=1 Tax=Brevundimonas sp. TaxID=1871086 RepID=UPI00356157A1